LENNRLRAFYENAFAGMLSWEQNIYEDLYPILQETDVSGDSLSSSPVKTSFEDKIIENKDTRILYNSRGEIVLIYSFVDRETLIVATEKNTLLEVFERLTSKRVSR